MIKYDLVKRTAEINRQNRKEIKEGCTALDPDPEYIKTFDDLEEAKKELAKRKTSVSKFKNHNMTFYSVEEYVIEENEFEFDEDENEFVQTGFIDTLETTPMKIEVVDILPPEKVALSLPAYAPVLPGISGTIYTLHKKYTVNRERRIFEDVKTVYLDAGQEATTEIDSCGNPVFLM